MTKFSSLKKISTVVLGTTCALVFTSNVSALTATDGTATISFAGAVTAVTCTVTAGSGAANTTTLPTMPTSALGSSGKVAGKTPFTITVSGCSGVSQAGTPIATAMPYFDITSTNILADNNLKNTLPAGADLTAAYVEFQILDAGTSAPVLLSAPWAGSAGSLPLATSGQGVTPHGLTGGSASFPFYVQYYATGQATAGQINSSVPVIMQYQ